MSVEENKQIARRYNDELHNKGNVDIIDELMSPDVIAHPGMRTREQVKEANLNPTPGKTLKVEDMIAEGDKVMFRWTMQAPHTWEYGGIAPTGKMVKLTGISIYRIVDGKIVEDWAQTDMLGFYKQWGYTPDMEQVEESTWE